MARNPVDLITHMQKKKCLAGVQIISSDKSVFFFFCYDLLFCFAYLSDANAYERARTRRAATERPKEKIENVPCVKTIWGFVGR